jgi:hypothetical protein
MCSGTLVLKLCPEDTLDKYPYASHQFAIPTGMALYIISSAYFWNKSVLVKSTQQGKVALARLPVLAHRCVISKACMCIFQVEDGEGLM